MHMTVSILVAILVFLRYICTQALEGLGMRVREPGYEGSRAWVRGFERLGMRVREPGYEGSRGWV